MWHWLVAYAFTFASVLMAGLYGFMSSTGPYAVVKALSLGLCAWGWCHGLAWAQRIKITHGWAYAVYVGLATLACLLVTIAGGLGTMSAGSSVVSGERLGVAARVALDKEKRAQLQGDLRKHSARAEAEVVAEIMTARASPAHRASNGCDPDLITLPKTREHCAAFRKLEGELGVAREIASTRAALAAVEERLKDAPTLVAADPQAEVISIITTLSIETSAALYAFAVTMALELMGAAAMLMAYSHGMTKPISDNQRSDQRAEIEQAPPKPKAPRPTELVDNPRPAPTVSEMPRPKLIQAPRKTAGGVYGSVSVFCKERTAPSQEERVKMGAVYRAYVRWCEENRFTAADPELFGKKLERACADVGASILPDQGVPYCVGLRLAS